MEQSLNVIILSSSDPQKLSLTLQSIVKNFSKNCVFWCLYTCPEELKGGYEWLKEKTATYLDIEFIYSNSFKRDLINTLKTKVTSKEVLFITDETVFFESFDYDVIKECLSQDDVLCLSLKLGNNTVFCNRMGTNNVIKAEEFENYIKWDWTKHYLDFGYPFSVRSHIYNVNEITKLIQKISFDNYHELEMGLQIFEHFPKNMMTAFKNSKSIVLTNDESYIHLEDFNVGIVPDIDTMDFSNIDRCEGEIYFETKKIIK